jgi:hypothetical protein
MPRSTKEWEITCDKKTFKTVREKEKFPYIVALARAVNAINAAHSPLLRSSKVETPERIRNGMNSYFFASALIYEGLSLIRRMNKAFVDDEDFQNGLRTLLKDPVAQEIELRHLNPARNHAVFHFLPNEFKKAIDKAGGDRFVFVVAIGKKKRALHYAYADVLTAEMLVGVPCDDPTFWSTFESAARQTSELVIKFTNDSENLIGKYLKMFGFKRE